jgi:hypothetical protein
MLQPQLGQFRLQTVGAIPLLLDLQVQQLRVNRRRRRRYRTHGDVRDVYQSRAAVVRLHSAIVFCSCRSELWTRAHVTDTGGMVINQSVA